MSNLIDRQKVLNTLDFVDNALTDEDRTVEKYKELLTECIKVLPSAENDGDLISRQAVENITWEEPSYSDPLNVLTEVREKVRALPSVENKGEWIPVTERLPKIADVYRVTRYYPNSVMHPRYLVDACFFDGSNTWYNDNRINHERPYAKNVIAWQENPEPYKEGGE